MKSFISSDGRLITYTRKGMNRHHISNEVPEIVCMDRGDAETIIKALVRLEELIGNEVNRIDENGNSISLSLDRLIDQVEGLIYDSNEKRGE